MTHELTQVKVLTGCPLQIGQRILGPEYDHLAALNLDLGGLPVREADLTDVVDQIRVHLNALAQALPPSEAGQWSPGGRV